MPIRVLIADDDALIREGLKIILSMDAEYEVAACVENGLEAVKFCRKEAVDVALLDIRMPLQNGVEAAREIVAQSQEALYLRGYSKELYYFHPQQNRS